MRPFHIRLLAVSILTGLAALVQAPAASALVVVSADVNIAYALNGAGVPAAPIDPGNQQFFTNVLSGGSTVAVLDDDPFGASSVGGEAIDGFYNGIGGVSSTLLASSTTITAATLAGIDMFVAVLPDAFSAAETTALVNFANAGGTLFLFGENFAFSARNAAINGVLTALGSAMSIVDDAFDQAVYFTAVGGQIAADPLTAGVATLSYVAPSQITGGTSLFFGTAGEAFVAYEAMAVAEPAALCLALAGLMALGVASRRRRQEAFSRA